MVTTYLREDPPIVLLDARGQYKDGSFKGIWNFLVDGKTAHDKEGRPVPTSELEAC